MTKFLCVCAFLLGALFADDAKFVFDKAIMVFCWSFNINYQTERERLEGLVIGSSVLSGDITIEQAMSFQDAYVDAESPFSRLHLLRSEKFNYCFENELFNDPYCSKLF